MATIKDDFSAREKLELGSHKTAFLLWARLRRAMDGTCVSSRTKDDPPAGGPGRNHSGKIVFGAQPAEKCSLQQFGAERWLDLLHRVTLDPGTRSATSQLD